MRDNGASERFRGVDLSCPRDGESLDRDGPLLQVIDVVKDFGGLRAVNHCNLDVRAGSITGLIGPNGAGKTTLFNLITGFLKSNGGQILFKGERIDGLPPHKLFHKGIVRTFQIPQELKRMTVLENLMLVPSRQAGERLWNTWFLPFKVWGQEREIEERALWVLDFVGLDELKDEYAGNLSSGQKKLLELARALMSDPELILLDEPGAGVNPTLMRRLSDHIERMSRELRVTFLLIEHNIDLVMRLCDPVIVMSSGEKIAEGPPEIVQRDERVLEAYLGGQNR
jgi:branched-chain amino acid transport system ATP-binding protein